MSKTFDPRRARAKRPCPMWIDAFIRDTLELEREDIGSYFLILGAMWSSVNCALHLDDKKLARVARVSPRKWSTTTKHIILPFFQTSGGALISKRLRKEAAFTEKYLAQQHCRTSGSNFKDILAEHKWDEIPENPKLNKKATKLETLMGSESGNENAAVNKRKPLINNNQALSVDISVGASADISYPITQYQDDADDSAGARQNGNYGDDQLTIREQIIVAMGHDKSGTTATGRQIGNPADMALVQQWMGLGLSIGDIIEQVASVTAKKRDGPAHSFKYFTGAMQELAGAKTAAPLEPIMPTGGTAHGRPATHEDKFRAALEAGARGTCDVDYG